MLQIYFGHPVNTYNTDKEATLTRFIQTIFPNHTIENPNQKKHQEGYKKYKESSGDGMNYFFWKVLPKMTSGVFLPFSDGMFGSGVFREALFMRDNGKKIHEINDDGLIKLISELDKRRMLSVEDTRKRLGRT